VKHAPCLAGVIQDVVVSDASPPVSPRFCDRLETPAPRPAKVSNNPWQESLSAWLLFRMFFDIQRSTSLAKETSSVSLP